MKDILDIRTPKCYYSKQRWGAQYILIFEDLSSADLLDTTKYES
jgi:hypothetical protein